MRCGRLFLGYAVSIQPINRFYFYLVQPEPRHLISDFSLPLPLPHAKPRYAQGGVYIRYLTNISASAVNS